MVGPQLSGEFNFFRVYKCLKYVPLLPAYAFAERGLALAAGVAGGETLAPALEAAMDCNLRENLREKCLLLHVGENRGITGYPVEFMGLLCQPYGN